MVNIVMLVRDRYRLTRQALQSLYAHTAREDFNLTLVDDSSEDYRTINLLNEYGQKANCAVLRIQTPTHILAQAKNLGVYWSESYFGVGDWLYLSDSDVYFLPNWLVDLTNVALETEKQDFLLWGGQVHPFHQPTTYNEFNDTFHVTTHDVLDGPSWLMRYGTWYEVGPLSGNTPGTCQSEEYPFCAEILRSGCRIGVINPHVVLHTGLTNTAGEDAPGREERETYMMKGVLYE